MLSLSPYASANAVTLSFIPYGEDVSPEEQRALYQPNLRGGFGLGISYRIADFSIGFRQRLDPVTEELYGHSAYANLSFRLWMSRHLLGEFTYQAIRGFSNLNTPLYDTTTRYSEQTPYEHRWDIKVRYLKMRTVYQFNPNKFSYRSAFSFSERQKKTAGGFLMNISIYNQNTTADSAFLPDAIRPFYGDLAQVNGFQITGLSLGPGIGGTWTGGRWFLSSVMFLGFDAQVFDYYAPVSGRWISELRPAPMFDFRLSFGYNAPRFFAGFQLWADANYLRPGPFKVNSVFVRNLLSVGYRFNSPKILNRVYDGAVNHLIPQPYRHLMY